MSFRVKMDAFLDRVDSWTLGKVEASSMALSGVLAHQGGFSKLETNDLVFSTLGVVLPMARGVLKGNRIVVNLTTPIFISLFMIWYLLPRWGIENMIVVLLFGIGWSLGNKKETE